MHASWHTGIGCSTCYRPRGTEMRIPGKGLLFPVLVLLLWEFAARSGFFVSTSLSHPSAILRAGWGLLIDGSLWRATRETFGAALGGMAIGACLGMVVGIA